MDIKLFIATPCYGGQVDVRYMTSVMNLMLLCQSKNIEAQFFKIPFESLIPRARNVCASAFLKSGYTHMIFIDADIEFNPQDVFNMIQLDKDIIGGNYPKKSIDHDLLYKTCSEKDKKSFQDTVSSSVNYTAQIMSSSVTNGFTECLFVATGFMLIKRQTLLTILDKYEDDIKYKNDVPPYKNILYKDHLYDFFQSKVTNGIYVSEDFGFCQLWRQCGGKIYTYLNANLNHIGQMIYYGNPMLRFAVSK